MTFTSEQNLKKGGGGRQYWGMGGGVVLHKIRGLAPFCQLCKETLKINHPPIIKAIPHS